ncbi:hypothetical protein [Streptomyces sp. NBC_00316]|uniref:hypothetical protein n=1 Tax=Streptomyces sp. NBC_00316 TaxID=2975710 RepID=UPI002E2B46C2|nr:hypothetical protein [Streptomyces sp. NBC_00316]
MGSRADAGAERTASDTTVGAIVDPEVKVIKDMTVTLSADEIRAPIPNPAPQVSHARRDSHRHPLSSCPHGLGAGVGS